jgi:hypothetical protein
MHHVESPVHPDTNLSRTVLLLDEVFEFILEL